VAIGHAERLTRNRAAGPATPTPEPLAQPIEKPGRITWVSDSGHAGGWTAHETRPLGGGRVS
jgi:hypothetical protein